MAVATGRILKNRTESLNTAALDQALRTTLRAECAKKEDESRLPQKEYTKRHYNMGKAIHWDLCRAKGFEHAERWYKHSPESVLENNDWNIL